MSNDWSNITAADNSRQHNGNVYNYYSKNYPLKQRRSDETLREDDRNRALLKAAAEGQTMRVRKLIEKGADVDFREGEDGLTALHHAVLSGFEDVVDELMAHGADINAVSSEFGSPICFAALKGRSNIFETLLSRRALLEAGTDFGSLAHAACCGGDRSIVESLETRGVSFEEPQKINANRMAEIRSSDILMLLKQLNVRIWMNCLPIHVAAFFGHTEVVELLLAIGAPARSTYSEISATGLSGAWKTETRYTALMAAAYSGNTETIKVLIDAGADINAKTASSGATALWIAAGLGRASSIPLLVDAKDGEGLGSEGIDPTALAVLLRQVATAEKRLSAGWRDAKATIGQLKKDFQVERSDLQQKVNHYEQCAIDRLIELKEARSSKDALEASYQVQKQDLEEGFRREREHLKHELSSCVRELAIKSDEADRAWRALEQRFAESKRSREPQITIMQAEQHESIHGHHDSPSSVNEGERKCCEALKSEHKRAYQDLESKLAIHVEALQKGHRAMLENRDHKHAQEIAVLKRALAKALAQQDQNHANHGALPPTAQGSTRLDSLIPKESKVSGPALYFSAPTISGHVGKHESERQPENRLQGVRVLNETGQAQSNLSPTTEELTQPGSPPQREPISSASASYLGPATRGGVSGSEDGEGEAQDRVQSVRKPNEPDQNRPFTSGTASKKKAKIGQTVLQRLADKKGPFWSHSRIPERERLDIQDEVLSPYTDIAFPPTCKPSGQPD